MAQLERIGATMEWRQGLEEESGKEENGDDTEGSKDSPGESQEEGTPSSASCQYTSFVFFLFNRIFIFYELMCE